MGASGSKASRAAGAATRQYPKGPKGPRPPTTTTTQQQAPQPQSQPPPSQTTNAPPQPPPAPNSSTGPTVKPQPHASSSRSEAINLDASDPDFARSLRSLGPVQPNPTLSPSSAFGQPVPSKADNGRGPVVPDPRKNPAIAVLHARERLAVKAEGEERRGRGPGAKGREFLDVFELRQVLVLRDVKGMTPREIERKMGLKEGVVGRLGGRGVLGLVREVGREKKGVDIV